MTDYILVTTEVARVHTKRVYVFMAENKEEAEKWLNTVPNHEKLLRRITKDTSRSTEKECVQFTAPMQKLFTR